MANRFFADFVGMPQEKVIDSLLEEVFTADEARQFRENNRRVIEAETPLIEEEWAEVPEGRRYFQTIKFPLRDPDRRTVAVGGISLDVTERRRAEEALSETRRAERRRIARDLHDVYCRTSRGRFSRCALPTAGQGSGTSLVWKGNRGSRAARSGLPQRHIRS